MLHPTMLGVVGQQCTSTGLIFAMFTSPIIHLVSLPKFCISIVLSFSFDDCITHEKLKTKVMQNLGANKVYYGRCSTGEFAICTSHIIQPSKEKLKTLLMQNFGGKTRRTMGEV